MNKIQAFFERFWFVFVILGFVLISIMGILLIANQKLFSRRRASAPSFPVFTPTPTPLVEGEATITALEEQGTSDEISAIEADLEATDFSEIDKELIEIEAEF